MRNTVKISPELASILLIPFIKDLVERCINIGFELEDILETLRQTVESIMKIMSLPTSDLRDIDYERYIELERFLEKLIEVASERDEMEKSMPMGGGGLLGPSSSPPPSSEDSSSPKSRKRQAAAVGAVGSANLSSSEIAMMRNPQEDERNLRPIVVDGSDVGFCESSQTFELSRIKAVVDYFEKRRHRIFVILPQWRKDQILALPNSARRTNSPNSSSTPVTSSTSTTSTSTTTTTSLTKGDEKNGSSLSLSGVDPAEELERMAKRGILHYTPTRVPSKFKYQEDSSILELAKKKNAVIVSNDNYKKFTQDDKFKEVIDERVLPYTIIDDEFLPSLSALGNTLENFLRFEPLQDSKFNKKCPYMQKNRCTFGAKCKYWHPERAVTAMGPNQSSTQASVKTANQKLNENVAENKMRFQIVLNETIQTQVSSRPPSSASSLIGKEQQQQQQPTSINMLIRPTATTTPTPSLATLTQVGGIKAPSTSIINSNSSSTAAAVAAASAYISRLGDDRKKLNELEKTAASLASLGSQFDRFSLTAASSSSAASNDFSTDSSNLFGLRSIVDNTTAAAAASIRPTAVVATTTTTANSWWSAETTNKTVNSAIDDRTDVRTKLLRVFTPEQVDQVLREHPNERDYKKLSYHANEMFLD